MRTTPRSAAAAAAVAALMALSAACGAGFGNNDGGRDGATTTPGPVADLVGPGCADYTKKVPQGRGSFEGMARDTVVAAADNNPYLTAFADAVSGRLNPRVNLVNTLNSGEFTVFAPIDTAFAKLDRVTRTKLGTRKGAASLKKLLDYDVVAGQMTPADVAGKHRTLDGADLMVAGSGDSIKVGTEQASVICGGIKTKNATVYLIDAVVMPPA
ncbi:fasciclin domain-containing protein [Aeromicrobium sp.]|uniref:fasciclin domain-containing protein n=1 Tax=Aeromicrobium sp. TaxID=1871063 RepID=UPI0019ADF6F0|nr:fasciclin domain-containing protein [Aeromicrobium sp.]MBC7630115.1 fasciclin domain-containing protein [Aeromicrobium sp.]